MRKQWVLFPMILCMLLLSLTAGSTASAATLLLWNEVNDETYGASVGARAFQTELRRLSGGEMDIDLYLEGMLGNEDHSMKAVINGDLDIFRGNAASLLDYGAELISMTGMPFLFSSMEEFEAMAVSPLGQELLDSVGQADCGYIALAWLVEGPRNLFITEKAYEQLGRPDHFTLDMMKQLSIRVPQTELLKQTMSALGSTPIEVTYSELLNTLKSDNIDGAENGLIPYVSLHFSDAAPYYIPDAHTFGCGVILVNRAVWDSLTEKEREWMKAAGKAASDVCYQYNLEQEKKLLEQFPRMGVTMLPISDIGRWQEACAPLYSRQSEAAREVIRRIRDKDW